MSVYSPIGKQEGKKEPKAMIVDTALPPTPNVSEKGATPEQIKTWLEIAGIIVSMLGLSGMAKRIHRWNKKRIEREKAWDTILELPKVCEGIVANLQTLKGGQDRIIEQQNQHGALTRQLASDAEIPMWRSDKNGLCVEVNRAFETMLGVSEKEVVGTGWKRMVYAQDRDAFVELWEETVKNILPLNATIRFVHGQDHWVIVLKMSGQPYQDAAGQLAGYVGSSVPVARNGNGHSVVSLPVASAGTE